MISDIAIRKSIVLCLNCKLKAFLMRDKIRRERRTPSMYGYNRMKKV